MDILGQRLLVFILVAFICETGSAIRCLNCTSPSLLPVAGCHEDFTEDFLVDCLPEATHCQVSRYKGAYGGLGLVRYERICTTEPKEDCILMDDFEYDGVLCTYSCDEDGCNAMNIFPNEPEYVPPEISTTPVTEKTVSAPIQCYNCSSEPFDPEDVCREDISDEYLVECPPEERFCLVTRVVTTLSDASFTNFVRSCSHEVPQMCEDVDFGEACFYSCNTAGCNNINVFPEEAGYKSTETTRAPTTRPNDVINDVTKSNRILLSTTSACKNGLPQRKVITALSWSCLAFIMKVL